MIHIENIPHVLQYGITHKNSQNANPDFIPIGDQSLIDTRSTKTVRVDNGDSFSINALTITLGDFIPFYFGVRMPMLYVIQNGGNFVEKATPPEKIIYLAYSLKRIIDLEHTYYFSDGHATDNFSSFYGKEKIGNLPNLIDWQAVKAPYWGGTENLNTKRKKQAEFLVSQDLAADGIIGFGCFNDVAKKQLIGMGVNSSKIKVIPKSYY